MNKTMGACLAAVLLVMLLAAGCGLWPDKALTGPADQVIYRGFREPPRIRYGTYPCAIAGTPLVGSDLGQHAYYWSPAEKDGIAYTCRAGHVDIIHLRIAADWTAYLTAESYRHLMKGDWQFSYKLAVDRSREYVQISYPRNWDSLPNEKRSDIAREVALALGPYLTYTMVTWHEILTWYGFKCVGLPVEYASAFSWEDSFSNLLGTRVAVQALQDKDHRYNEAVKIALDEEMQWLGIQPAHVAKEASDSVKGRWFTGEIALFVDMKKRNFDIGLDDGFVTPTLVPDEPACPDAEPISYPAPALDVLAKHGFAIHIEIEPHEWEKDTVLCIAGENCRIDPQAEFPRLMDHLRRQAAARYGPEYSPDYEKTGPVAYRGK
jgi:hypothetical protein